MKRQFDLLEEASVDVRETLWLIAGDIRSMVKELNQTNKIAISVTIVNVITLIVLMITLW
tara:strand:- start:326 stop:505 length:180 start_codon:yes stop_codon:yes gene_type:complete